jgi:hypothetical protein
MPIPRPATVQTATAAAADTPEYRTRTIPEMPAMMIASPVRMRRRPSQVSLRWAWIHAPHVQATVAPVTANPARSTLPWRTAVIDRVT